MKRSTLARALAAALSLSLASPAPAAVVEAVRAAVPLDGAPLAVPALSASAPALAGSLSLSAAAC
ncbi:MAG: dihydrolipoamide acetyltransferase, partial [Elusimicrobia bacterium]|nr:dihydrolipoamide acetyltransferase [Elusimicrobiota bacterium]